MFIPVTIIYASFLMLLMYLSVLHLLLLLGLYSVTICSVTAEFQIEMKPHIKSDISKEVLHINTLCGSSQFRYKHIFGYPEDLDLLIIFLHNMIFFEPVNYCRLHFCRCSCCYFADHLPLPVPHSGIF